MSNKVKMDWGEPNPIQERALAAFRNGKRIVLLVSGRQAGKSHVGARWLISQTMRPDAKHKLAFAVAPTFRMARVIQRKIEEVLKSDPALWKRIKATKQPIPTYEFPNGWIIEVHSSDDPDSLRGPSVDAVWYDEAAKGTGESFDILMPTLLATKGNFLGTTTPRGKTNWTYNKIYRKACPPGHPDHDPDLYHKAYEIVSGSTWENVENLSEDAVQQLEDQYGKGTSFGKQEIAGEFVSYDGLVYNWNEINFVPHSSLPERHEYEMVVGGIDFGWTDPFAAVVLGYKDNTWYAIDGIYESHLETQERNIHVASLTEAYDVKQWFADSASPDSIADLRSAGIPVLPVIKPTIEESIMVMAQFADNHRFKVSFRLPDLRNELQMYQYPEEHKLLNDKRRNPVDRNNHFLDAVRYAIWMNRHLWISPHLLKKHKGEDGGKDPDGEERFMVKGPKTKSTGPAGIYGL